MQRNIKKEMMIVKNFSNYRLHDFMMINIDIMCRSYKIL